MDTQPAGEVHPFPLASPWLARIEERLEAVARSDGAATQAIMDYISRSGGKRLRPLLVLLCAQAFGSGPGGADPLAAPQLRDLAVAVELIHVASLLHDDLIDGAAERRGLPTVTRRWGPAMAVLSGDYLFSAAFEQLVACGLFEAVRLMSWALRSMSEAEIEQLGVLHDPDITEGEYLRMVRGKTASLFAAACAAGAVAGGADRERAGLAHSFGEHLGVAYQLADDLLDVIGHPKDLGKPIGQDLGRGSVTLPVIFLLRGSPVSHELRQIVASRGFTREMAGWLREHVLSSGARYRTRGVIQAELEKAWSSLGGLEGAAQLRARALLEPVVRFVLDWSAPVETPLGKP